MKRGVRNALIATIVLLTALAAFIRFAIPLTTPIAPEIEIPHLTVAEKTRFPTYHTGHTSEQLARSLEEKVRKLLIEGKTDEARTAINQLKQLPEGAVHPQKIKLLERALLEGVELRRGESPYAVVSYDGVEGDDLGGEALALIDETIGDLAALFGFMPEEKIQVVIYSDPRFSSASGAPLPEWVEAGFDGKLRLPVELIYNRERRERVIRHELSHAFSYLMARGKVPIWLDEGIAQWIEGRTTPYCWSREWDFPPMERLIAPFIQEQDPQAVQILYQSSLALLEHLIALKGWHALQGYLGELKQGKPEKETFFKQFELTHQQAWADAQISLVSRFCPSAKNEPDFEENNPQEEEIVEIPRTVEAESIDPRLSPEAEEYELYPTDPNLPLDNSTSPAEDDQVSIVEQSAEE